ncbi:MAG: carbohydrate ABC transporter permease [Anaerolineae bacterium]
MSATGTGAVAPEVAARPVRHGRRRSWGWIAVRGVAYLLLSIWGFVSLFPLYWLLVAAFSPPSVVMTTPPHMFPSPATTVNFVRLAGVSTVFRWLSNSLLVATTVSVTNIILGTMAGYVLAKKRFPGANVAFWAIILTMMVPGQATMVPMYLLVSKLGWLNSFNAVIIPDLVIAFSIFLMKQYLSNFPTELIEAAKLDGANELRILFQIVMPVAKPGIAVLGIFTFVDYWNGFFWPLLVLSSKEKLTVQVGLTTLRFQYSTDYGLWNAGAVLAMVPVFIVFFSFQRYFLRGVTIGAIKG